MELRHGAARERGVPAAFRVARYVLLFGVGSLLLELGIMSWVLRQQITRPLVGFTQAADQVAAGDFQVELDTSREDELGRLAHAFRLMAQEVQRREEALRQANEGLEQRVEERTRELQEVHKQLVETARQAGRAEIATNVLHNVGNVLNSVYTSALLARERLAGMKLDSVESVAALLEEHQADSASFLTQDERGRNALPFLERLGQHLQSRAPGDPERCSTTSAGTPSTSAPSSSCSSATPARPAAARDGAVGRAGGGCPAHQPGRAHPPRGEGGAGPGAAAARAHGEAQGADDPRQPDQQRQVRAGRACPRASGS